MTHIRWGGKWVHLANIWIVSHLSAKNYQNWCKFDEVLTKTNLLCFLGHGVYYFGVIFGMLGPRSNALLRPICSLVVIGAMDVRRVVVSEPSHVTSGPTSGELQAIYPSPHASNPSAAAIGIPISEPQTAFRPVAKRQVCIRLFVTSRFTSICRLVRYCQLFVHCDK